MNSEIVISNIVKGIWNISNFLTIIFAANQFLSWSKDETTAKLSQTVQKWLFVTFAILTVDISNKNDCNLDKILRNFHKGHFVEKLDGFCEIVICVLCLNAFIFNYTSIWVLWCVCIQHYCRLCLSTHIPLQLPVPRIRNIMTCSFLFSTGYSSARQQLHWFWLDF